MNGVYEETIRCPPRAIIDSSFSLSVQDCVLSISDSFRCLHLKTLVSRGSEMRKNSSDHAIFTKSSRDHRIIYLIQQNRQDEFILLLSCNMISIRIRFHQAFFYQLVGIAFSAFLLLEVSHQPWPLRLLSACSALLVISNFILSSSHCHETCCVCPTLICSRTFEYLITSTVR